MLSIVTGSERKKSEIKKYIGDKIRYAFVSLDLEEIQGTKEEIVRRKLKEAQKHVEGPVVIEDYSLHIDFLEGFPGPYIKSLLFNHAFRNIVHTLSKLGPVHCTAECTYGYQAPGKEPVLVAARARGQLVPNEVAVPILYGVDNHFVQQGTDKPFAQLSPEDQDRISIRKQALQELAEMIMHDEKNATEEKDICNR